MEKLKEIALALLMTDLGYMADGVPQVVKEFIESKLDAKESNDEIETNAVYKDFMKNSSR